MNISLDDYIKEQEKKDEDAETARYAENYTIDDYIKGLMKFEAISDAKRAELQGSEEFIGRKLKHNDLRHVLNARAANLQKTIAENSFSNLDDYVGKTFKPCGKHCDLSTCKSSVLSRQHSQQWRLHRYCHEKRALQLRNTTINKNYRNNGRVYVPADSLSTVYYQRFKHMDTEEYKKARACNFYADPEVVDWRNDKVVDWRKPLLDKNVANRGPEIVDNCTGNGNNSFVLPSTSNFVPKTYKNYRASIIRNIDPAGETGFMNNPSFNGAVDPALNVGTQANSDVESVSTALMLLALAAMK